MIIEEYSFGRILIDGKSYTSDVIVFPDRLECPWWREQGHQLAMRDLGMVVEAAPRSLLIGTGYYGRMKVPAETRQALLDSGIDVRVGPTGDAVARFQRLEADGANVVAALHLTC